MSVHLTSAGVGRALMRSSVRLCLLLIGLLWKTQRRRKNANDVREAWWASLDSNQGPQSYQDCALTG